MAIKDTNSVVQLAEVFAQSKSNAEQIQSLGERLDQFGRALDNIRDSVNRGFAEVRDRVSDSTKPNFQLATIILGIVGMVATPVGIYFTSSLQRVERASERGLESLDTKLQKEFQLSIETARQGIANLDSRSLERHVEAVRAVEQNAEGIKRLQEWQDYQVKSDLDELRRRRSNEIK